MGCEVTVADPGPPKWPLLPLEGLLALGDVAVRWGMFSGTGCREPMLVTPTSEALPALLRA